MMEDYEIKEFIREAIHDSIHSTLMDYRISKRELESEIGQLRFEHNAIKKHIQDHALGVQRVYDEFTLIKKKLNLTYVQDLIDLIKRNDPELINAQLKKYSELLNDSYAKDALNRFKKIQKDIEEMHFALCKY